MCIGIALVYSLFPIMPSPTSRFPSNSGNCYSKLSDDASLEAGLDLVASGLQDWLNIYSLLPFSTPLSSLISTSRVFLDY